MQYFYLADKDGSGALTKQECRQLLLDLLNAKVSKDDFEKLFQVSKNVNVCQYSIEFLRKRIKVVKEC